jgi:DNA-binding NtrC family response regulator
MTRTSAARGPPPMRPKLRQKWGSARGTGRQDGWQDRVLTSERMLGETEDTTRDSGPRGADARPGVVVVFSGATPLFYPFAMDGDTPLLIGRGGPIGAVLRDDRVSREHAEVARVDGAWRVRDLGSRNGTFVDGVQVQARGEVTVASLRVIRAGDTVLVPSSDVASVAYPPGPMSPAGGAKAGGPVIGSKLKRALDGVDRAAAGSETLLILGETGTGKELAARRFHEHGPHARGPFIAVNCAAIPEGLAERLLFGAKRGTYSGAVTDTIGHIQAAGSGVLFLDEGGELDLQVQAKLLRVLETREVVPLGAAQGTQVALRICVATHRDLRADVGAGRFRADLYHRIAPPDVSLPPLRDRLDEITQHIAEAIAHAAPALPPQSKLVEACLLRHWPGNVRELRKHIRDAALLALSAGTDRVRLEHLSPDAGAPIELPPAKARAGSGPAHAPAAPKETRAYVRRSESLTREGIEAAIARHGGNVALAARSLGMARSQFYREMARLEVRRPGKKGEA